MHQCYACDDLAAVHRRNGRGGIRTHGGLPHARFRVECLKPDSATLPCRNMKMSKPACAKNLGVASVERRTSNPPSQVATARQESNATVFDNCAFSVGRRTLSICIELIPLGFAERPGRQDCLCRSKKMLQFRACKVRPTYCILYIHTDSHAITCC